MAGWPNQIDTVGDLQTALAHYNPDTPIRWAAQPRHPIEHTTEQVARTPDETAGDGAACTDPPVVWLGAGEQVGYRPAPVASGARLVVMTTPTTPPPIGHDDAPQPLLEQISETDHRCTRCGATNSGEWDSFPSFGGTTEWWERCNACGASSSGCDLTAVL